ncbi:MAG: diguanylate cyclase (GGDEF)-like protein [Candidatus Endobugula sp.]
MNSDVNSDVKNGVKSTATKVLIVEDSPIVAKILLHIAKQELNFDVILASTFAEARQICEQQREDIFAALVDLNLPDAPDGEVVDYTLEQKIPTIVLTGSFDDKRREKLLSKGIVDYVTKEGRYSYKYAIKAVNRLEKNQFVKVLVVEDSKVMRKHIVNLLSRHQFEIYQAVDGIDAIKVILEHPDIRLLITDYNMPNMDGFELVKNLRCKYEKFDLIIIGLSAAGESNLSAKLIKTGANDFLSKPFNPEEFYCRINHNIEALDLVDQIRDSANRDYVSGLYSRRYFFEQSESLYATAHANSSPLSLAIISIDDFKQVNDSLGPEIGDLVLKQFAQVLEKSLSRFLVARSSGKEFYILMAGLSNDKAITLIDHVRAVVASESFSHQEQKIGITFSAGVSSQLGERIGDQVAVAENCLLRAKQAGKDVVMGDDNDEEEDSQ